MSKAVLLYNNFKKYIFMTRSGKWNVGFVPECKVHSMKAFRQPKSKKELRAYLGLISWVLGIYIEERDLPET